MKNAKIIFATKNKGKLKEIKEIMSDKYEILSIEEAGINIEIIEDGKTFEENALKKACAVMKECGEIVLADDSGLEIDYLNKAPGIYSARYMGEDTPYEVKNKKILELLDGVEEDKRTARFVCAIAAAIPNYGTITVKETIEGIIGYNISGKNGFGYDPIFYLPDRKKTTAELSMEEKNEISHRGKALIKMKKKLKDIMEKKS